MAYRDDVAALEARLAALTADAEVRLRERDEVARLLAETRARADVAPRGSSRRRRAGFPTAFVIAGLAVGIGIAMGSMSESKPSHESSVALAHLEQLADEMCRCVTRTCAERVDDEVAQWSSGVVTSWRARLDAADSQRAAELDAQLATCRDLTVSPGPRSKLEP